MLVLLAVLCTAPAGPSVRGQDPAASPSLPVASARAATPAGPRPDPGQAVIRRPSSDEPAAPTPTGPPRGRGTAPPVPTPRPAPDPGPAVATMRASVRIDEVADPAALQRVLATAGVAHATSVRIGRTAVGTGARADAELVVAAVDPDGFRPFTPEVTASTPGVWQRLDEGAIAVAHEHAERLDLELGSTVLLGGVHAVPVRVGAFASNGIPPVAGAIVDPITGARLGLDEITPTILVGVDQGASSHEVADRLEDRLHHDVVVVPDPRVPHPVSAVPPPGATVWDVLAACESSGNWDANTGNGYYGGLQFLPESWRLVGGTGLPHEATREEQIARAERLLAVQGWKAWPVCSVRLGLRPAPVP